MAIYFALLVLVGCKSPLEPNAFVDVDRSGSRTCGVTAAGEAFCWDDGNREISWSEAPQTGYVSLFELTDAIGVASREHDACVLRDSGDVLCVAFDGDGNSLGYPSIPSAIEGLDNFVSIEAGPRHYCGITDEGGVSCWGEISGKLWGEETFFETPQVVPDIEKARVLSLGKAHSCAVQKDGLVKCWGDPDWGRLGASAHETITVPDLPEAVDVAVSLRHTCAVADSQVWCWGHEPVIVGGEVSPPQVIEGIEGSVAIGGGLSLTCAVDKDGQAQCFERNDDPERPSRWYEPESVSGLGEPGVVFGNIESICSIDDLGALQCIDARVQ